MTILKRELAAYFNAATAYIFMIVFVLITTGIFMTQFFIMGRADMLNFFSLLPLFLSVFVPAITMRVWAEERKGNTLELLLTFPMSTQQLVTGKFLGSFIFYLMSLGATFPIPIMLHYLGNPDMGAIAGGYLGAAFLGAFYIALGLFMSGLVRDQIVAFILSMMACFSLHLIGSDFLAQSLDGWVSGLGTFLQQNLGSAGYFDSFAKGVIDGSAVIYFSLGTIIFLILNGFWLEGRMRPFAKTIFSTALIISLGIFFTANWLLNDFSLGRYDLTKGKLFTVSDASKRILKSLEAPVSVKLYMSPSEKMPTGMKTLEQDLLGKLEEFKAVSQGKLQYKVYHLDPNNLRTGPVAEEIEDLNLEERLHMKGIQPFQVQSIESDEVGVRLIYAAMTLGYKEKSEEVLPQLMPEVLHSLEYDVVSRVHRMTLESKPRVGLYAPYQMLDADPNMQALMMQLGGNAPQRRRIDDYDLLSQALAQEGYDIVRFEFTKADPIPEDIETLVVLEPLELNERQRYELNRFVVEGGSLFLAVQNYEYQYDPSGAQLRIVGSQNNPQINSLLQQWGLYVDDDILADEQNQVISLAGGAQLGPFALNIPVKTPIQIIVSTDAMNEELSISSQLPPLFYLWGSAVHLDDQFLSEHKISASPLFYSSPYSWTVPYEKDELNSADLDPVHTVRQGPFTLAAFLQGEFPDAYANQAVPSWPQSGEADEEKAAVESSAALSPASGKIILTGAATMFQKQLIQSGGHYNFILNSLDVLTLGDDLVQIRSKKPINRTIGRVSREEKILWRFLVSGLTPLILAALGITFALIRTRSKQSYLKSLVTKSSSDL